MKIAFAKPDLPAGGVVVVGVLEDNQLSPSAATLDEATAGALTRAMGASAFKGKREQRLSLLAPHGSKLDRIELVGLGKAESLEAKPLQSLGGNLYASLSRGQAAKVVVMVDGYEDAPLTADAMAAEMAYGALLRTYRFDKYRTKEKEDAKPKLKTLSFACEGNAKARKTFQPLAQIAEGVFFTRDLQSEPANILYPEEVCARAKELTELGVKVEVLGEKEMAKLGMGALLGVGQGSIRESKLLVMQWNGAGTAKAAKGKKAKDVADPIAFVGKGVCFDTGGISIKPAGGMEDMKWDMGGAGVVCGLMKALAGRKAKANVVGIAGLVENMPDGNAQRPGDIVTSMSGQTIEVLNTDAEGRLVLADALWYCKERFKPTFMIDLATLTGAIIVSLADQYAGLFSNDDELCERLDAAGKTTGEMLWRFPLNDAYDKMINSDAADMKNIGGRGAGSITAAQFLKRFVDDVPWAHLDIAGVTWSKKDMPTVPKGATAFGVRLLDQLVKDHYEG
ncbi:MAG: leucyl aminopeptidase [Magnetovibrionaceae bacterium]